MPSSEKRVDVLETRVDELKSLPREAVRVSATASRDAVPARQAEQRNMQLLNGLRETQAEHSRILVDQSQVLADRSQRFDSIDATLARLTVGVHTIESLLRRALDEDG
jgi:hypothetical protein